MRAYFISILLAFLLYGCPPCDPVVLDNGPLPDSILALVPYSNGNIYRLRHSNGQLINYTSQRFSNKEIMECHPCCDYTFSYETNITRLTPDYPVFNISITLSNADTIQYEFTCFIGTYFLNIPVGRSQTGEFYHFSDSVLIGETYYYDVFRIKPSNNYLWNDYIKVDSVYYNSTSGILLIKMSNEEYFSIVD